MKLPHPAPGVDRHTDTHPHPSPSILGGRTLGTVGIQTPKDLLASLPFFYFFEEWVLGKIGNLKWDILETKY